MYLIFDESRGTKRDRGMIGDCDPVYPIPKIRPDLMLIVTIPHVRSC